MSVAKKPERIHTVTWQDPEISARDANSITGLDYLRSVKEGKIEPPPSAMLIGHRLAEVDTGFAVFQLQPAEYHYNPFASVHGGIAATLLDSAMSAAVLSTLPIGRSCSTIEMKVNFVRSITSGTGLLRCEGKIIHVGNRTATAEGKVIDGKENLYAHAISTCMIYGARKKA